MSSVESVRVDVFPMSSVVGELDPARFKRQHRPRQHTDGLPEGSAGVVAGGGEGELVEQVSADWEPLAELDAAGVDDTSTAEHDLGVDVHFVGHGDSSTSGGEGTPLDHTVEAGECGGGDSSDPRTPEGGAR